jgi:hypothetical protein
VPVGLSQSTSLVLLFVVLPFVVGGLVMWAVARRAPEVPAGTRTSELLESGEPASGEIMERRLAGGFLDTRPMVHFLVQVNTSDGEELRLIVTQAIPRRALGGLVPGRRVGIRLSADRATGAIEVPD